MTGNEEDILVMRGITKKFPGVTALNGLDFCVKKASVHAIVGENGAGKSTLMKIICGAYSMDKGEYFFKGKQRLLLSPLMGLNMGVSIIHQELSPIMDMTITENIFLGREPLTKRGFVDFMKMEEHTNKLMDTMGYYLNPKQKMRTLTVTEMQIIEIIKAISRDSSLVIMDEPTSSLSEKEINLLFKQIRKLTERGISVIFISHKLTEIFTIADEITVMRDGQKISNGSVSEYTMDRLISEMVGRELSNVYPKLDSEIGDKVFEVKNFTHRKKFKDISFHVNKGEILGFYGLVGAGRTELMQSIFGLDTIESGKMFLYDKEITVKHPADAVKKGIAMASEDRKQYGLVLCRSVRENMSLSNLDAVLNKGLIDKNAETEMVYKMVHRMNIKCPSLNTNAFNLSGGNQQKVVLGKWLLKDMQVMLLDEPTRGIDVGAKYEIYNMIGEIAQTGIAIIVVSSEIPELLGICDRICVMSMGKITGEFTREEANQEAIMKAAFASFIN